MRQPELPAGIAAHTGGRPYRENGTGKSGARVLMYEDLVLKIQPSSPRNDREEVMLRWLEGRVPAPRIVCAEDADGLHYCLMTRVPGRMACDIAFLDRPELLIRRLAEALQLLWSVDLAGCPVRRTVDVELAEARQRVAAGVVDVEDAEPGTFGPGGFGDPEALLDWLESNRPDSAEGDVVLSHGDFCLPNILLTENGLGGFIDLGDAGVGSRWRDITLCHRSLRHNTDGTYGIIRPQVKADALLDCLGLRIDRDELRWYLLLDELF